MSPYALYPLTNQRTVSHHAGLAGELSIAAFKVVEAIETAATWIVRSYRRNSAIRELSRLDDHMLKDIGVSRSEIRAVVDGVLDAPVVHQVARPRAQSVRPATKTELPVADNDTDSGRQQNRRVEIIVSGDVIGVPVGT